MYDTFAAVVQVRDKNCHLSDNGPLLPRFIEIRSLSSRQPANNIADIRNLCWYVAKILVMWDSWTNYTHAGGLSTWGTSPIFH